ncbi:MAG: N-acetylmuramic acid 6-phosphate etherase [Planctomycetes bacterium]|nr:N-acetylmuramic acid 6-phosphate etherase [Planctomycetota bacterium]
MMADEGSELRGLDDLATEKANPASRDLDLLDTESMLRVMNEADRGVALAVALEIPRIAIVVDRAARSLAEGGRLHSFGAGTSGRIALLDAVECPPTFGVPADLVQGHLAGGEAAFVRAKEGAEDSLALGEQEVQDAGIRAVDVVLAISASGRTPYGLGVLAAARARGAFTVAIVGNPESPMAGAADQAVVPVTGEEILSGSTRLKAGTAQKMVLNMISTGVMVRLGRTYGNLMIGVQPTNEKLRRRALRLLETITGKDHGLEAALDAADGDLRVAALLVAKNHDLETACARLAACGGSLRRAMENPS